MRFRPTLVFICLLHALPCRAETFSIKEISYAEIEDFVPDAIDFETLGQPPADGVLAYPGVTFGERFYGQTLKIKQDDGLVWHEVLDHKVPAAPLRPQAGAGGQNLAIRPDGHWGSLALHPLGPDPGRNLGTGALAIRFDPPVCFLAFRTGIDGMSRHANVNNTVLRGKAEGSLNIRFYNAEGGQLASFMRSYNPEGAVALGYMQAGQAEAQIAGVFLQNLDLGGIAIDDLRFDPLCPLKLF